MRVAKNKAIDILRRDANLARKMSNGELNGPVVTQIEQLFLDGEIADSQLRLLFMCCHPSLRLQDQIALNLKISCGFGRKEIARALLTTEENVKKRLHRARKKIKDEQIELVMPDKEQLQKRLQSVLMVIYLIFNEGYHSTKVDQLIQKDLCLDAMRLCKLLYDHPAVEDSSIQALMALMCFHAARFGSRIDEDDHIILLKDQDRSKWDEQLIKVGTHFYQESWQSSAYSQYHIEAAIALEYYVAPTYEQTNWDKILKLYDWLEEHRSTPIILLNKIIVCMEMGDLDRAKEICQTLDPKQLKGRLHLYHAVLAEIHRRSADDDQADLHLKMALDLAPTTIEKNMLEKRLAAVADPRIYN